MALKTSFEFIWAQYRSWTVTAAKLKKQLMRWRVAVLTLTIAGAFTAILSQTFLLQGYGFVSQILGWISAGAMAVTGYAARKILTGEQEKRWLLARSAAESCKSNAYLYLFQITPYVSREDDKILYEKIETYIRTLSTIPQVTLSQQEELKNIPPADYSFAHYLDKRIRKQAHEYYLPQATKYRRYVKRSNTYTIALGAIGFLLGAYGATTASSLSVWIAFVSTVSASLTTFMNSNQYQYLALSYQVMGTRLKIMLMKGVRIAPEDVDAQKDFIRTAEEMLSSENQAWLSELSKTETEEPPEPTTPIPAE